MKLFGNKKPDLFESLLNIQYGDQLFQKLTSLQNEINVAYDTKVIALTSCENDSLVAAFAKALADTYAANGSSSMIIDANLYNPCLEKVLNKSKAITGNVKESGMMVQDGSVNGSYKMSFLNRKTSIITIDKQIYPGAVFKNKIIQKWINDGSKNYDHFIIIAPSIKKHKEVLLLNDVIKSMVLITQRNITKKKDIFDVISYSRENNLPLAKTVVIE